MIIREANINDADALSIIYKHYVDNSPYSFEYVAPSADEFAERIADISEKFPLISLSGANRLVASCSMPKTLYLPSRLGSLINYTAIPKLLSAADGKLLFVFEVNRHSKDFSVLIRLVNQLDI